MHKELVKKQVPDAELKSNGYAYYVFSHLAGTLGTFSVSPNLAWKSAFYHLSNK